ncbi:hypothetical protein OG291_01195 [Streptomyces halstedii]|uniref:hypothetical protein n=1 Tax=Streptomyces halstedii TaxID=1944 RepID=UPI00386C4A7D|nr:hypothetical protein OG291_01195 [Streptomyces halstedii]
MSTLALWDEVVREAGVYAGNIYLAPDTAGRAIALNATQDARDVADHALDTDDLRDVLTLLR